MISALQDLHPDKPFLVADAAGAGLELLLSAVEHGVREFVPELFAMATASVLFLGGSGHSCRLVAAEARVRNSLYMRSIRRTGISINDSARHKTETSSA